MRRKLTLLSLALFFATGAWAAGPLSLGIKGGVGLTDAYGNTSLASGSTSKDYIVGPFAELRLPFGLGLEADALYRPLSLNNTRANSWEFPVLAKYRFGTPLIKPFIEAGPSFRASGSAPNLSNDGFTAGFGVEFKLPFLRVSPDLRYTRWTSGPAPSGYANQNQLEFLVGLSF